jgi:SAM-dependent methyltransferase
MRPRTRRIAWTAAVVLILLVTLGWPILAGVAFHFAPVSWTGEADRLAAVLALRPGARVAEVGAGTGWLAVEMARRVGPEGRLYATELSEDRLRDLHALAADSGLSQLEIVRAEEDAPGLPPGCCDALYMRNVAHHLSDLGRYAAEVRKVLRPGGKVVVIDFVPGALFHLAGDHGVTRDAILAAFSPQGFVVEQEIEDWGGGMYLLALRLEKASLLAKTL